MYMNSYVIVLNVSQSPLDFWVPRLRFLTVCLVGGSKNEL